MDTTGDGGGGNSVKISPIKLLKFQGRSNEDECFAEISITNRSSKVLAYKVKLSRPEAYRIEYHGAGLIKKNGTLSLNAVLLPGRESHMLVPNDVIQIMMSVVEGDRAYIAKLNDQSEIQLLWKKLDPGTTGAIKSYKEYNLQCAVVYGKDNPEGIATSKFDPKIKLNTIKIRDLAIGPDRSTMKVGKVIREIDGLILSEHKLKTHMSAMIKFVLFVGALFMFCVIGIVILYRSAAK